MGIYEELEARGLIAQVTDEAEIESLKMRERLSSILALTPRRIPCMWGILWPCV